MDLSQMQALQGEEIIEIIRKAELFGGLAFQTGSLQMVTGSIHRVETTVGKLVMHVLGECRLDESISFCANFAYRNFTFSVPAGKFTVHPDRIVCDVPKAGKAIPARPGGERHILPLDSSMIASLHRIEKRDSFCSLSVRIVDVSKAGLGAYVLGSSEGHLMQYDHVWIREFNQKKLLTPVFCRVEYVNERRYKDHETLLRVGLSTEKDLPAEIYEETVKRCRLVLAA